MGEKTSEESLLKTWSEAQQRVLAGWLDLVQAAQLAKPPSSSGIPLHGPPHFITS